MIKGEAISQVFQSDDATALSAPVSASIAHLKVNGTDSVASFATSSSTIDQTTRILRSTRSLGQTYGHRCTSVPISVACSIDLWAAGASFAAGGESPWAINMSLEQDGGTDRCRADFSFVLHCARHIERLNAARTLANRNSFAISAIWG